MLIKRTKRIINENNYCVELRSVRATSVRPSDHRALFYDWLKDRGFPSPAKLGILVVVSAGEPR